MVTCTDGWGSAAVGGCFFFLVLQLCLLFGGERDVGYHYGFMDTARLLEYLQHMLANRVV